MTEKATELRGRVNVFFVSAPVFKALRMGYIDLISREKSFTL